MSRIVFVSEDVLFWSRVASLARSSGADAVRVGDEAAMERVFREGGVTRVIVDLGVRGIDLASWASRWAGIDPRPELIAFGSHVDEAALAAARAAGFDRVMPNSRFHREVGELVR